MEGTIKIIIVNYCHHLISSIRSPQLRANLIPEHNLWFAVFDFNDDAKTGKNWKLLENESEWEPCWCPLGEFENAAKPERGRHGGRGHSTDHAGSATVGERRNDVLWVRH